MLQNYQYVIVSIFLFLQSTASFADIDPATKASSEIRHIMFGAFGTSICAIFIGAMFVMAYAGKITWDRFIFIVFCTAGFLGAESIVNLISNWVN